MNEHKVNDSVEGSAPHAMYTFTQEMHVWDVEVLYRAAFAHLTNSGVTEEDARQFLDAENGKPNIEACLVELLDQTIDGCTVHHSGAERRDV